MSAPAGGGGRKSALADINVTPLVDVMLVLLIIFMVTAPLIQQGVKVSLPDAKAAPIDAKEKKLVVSLDRAGKIYIGEAEVGVWPNAVEELEAKLKANAKAQADKEIYLHADKDLKYGIVVDVMAAAQRAGIPNVGMVTDPVQREASRQ
ncbi:MAG: protein TolR [Myxococcales bacterium]